MFENCLEFRFVKIMIRTLSAAILFAIVLASCSSRSDSEVLGKIQPITSCEIIRTDQFFQGGTQLTSEQLLSFEKKYPEFSAVFFEHILAIRADHKLSDLNTMIQDSGYIRLYSDVELKYKEMASMEPELSQALENYQRIFDLEATSLPRLYTFLSGFTVQCFLFEDKLGEAVGIGLDMFLGPEFPYHSIDPDNPIFSSYLTSHYYQGAISKKVIEVLVEDKLPLPDQSDFLSLIIWGGKKWYLMDQILDFKPDTIIPEYSAEQLEWCHKNQKEMWAYFFEKSLFYETDIRKFNKLVAPSPNSPGMPKEAPGQTGNYMGWQIVREFAKRNNQVSIKELIQMDAQTLLDKSKFKPSRKS